MNELDMKLMEFRKKFQKYYEEYSGDEGIDKGFFCAKYEVTCDAFYQLINGKVDNYIIIVPFLKKVKEDTKELEQLLIDIYKEESL